MSVNINSSSFSPNVYNKAMEFAKDGKIDDAELKELVKEAEKDGLNTDESNFLTGLLDEKNVATFKAYDSEPKTITFDVSRFSENATKLEAAKAQNGMSSLKNASDVNPANPTSNYDENGSDTVQPVTGNSSFKSDWKVLNKPAEEIKNKYSAKLSPDELENELKTRLKIDDKWTGRPELKTFVETLKKNGALTPENAAFIEKLAKTQPPGTVGKISANLTEYYNSYKPPGQEQKDIIHDALHDVSYPANIRQKTKGTCAAAAVQMKFAKEKPEEYTKMLTTLAKDQDYKTASGDIIKPNKTYKGDTDDERSLSSKIMQCSFMGYCGGSYDSKSDKTNGESGGLTTSQEMKLINKLWGNADYSSHEKGGGFLGIGSNSADDLFAEMEDDLARGKSVPVTFEGHAVLVTGLDKTASPPVVIINSYGRQYTMSVDDFKKNVQSVQTDDDSGKDNMKVKDKKFTEYYEPAKV